MTFNAPPNWPVPRGWSPPPDWEPPSSWPPAPTGWTFWIDEQIPRRRWWRLSKGSVTAISATTVLLGVVVVVAVVSMRPAGIKLQPYTVTPTASGTSPTWADPGWGTTPLYIDFAGWTRFGGIDATTDSGGRAVHLDTHDSTDTWRTKWSGIVSPKTTACSVRIAGRVRDISHTAGIPGGFSIGIGRLEPGDIDDAALTGSAIQFDFGQLGYRDAVYPSDTDNGLVPATLDHEWHQAELVMTADSHTLTVDGRTAATARGARQCGHPFIRVWAGSAEFADFTVTPLG